MFSSCALPEPGRASETNVNKLTDFQYASLFSGAHERSQVCSWPVPTALCITLLFLQVLDASSSCKCLSLASKLEVRMAKFGEQYTLFCCVLVDTRQPPSLSRVQSAEATTYRVQSAEAMTHLQLEITLTKQY